MPIVDAEGLTRIQAQSRIPVTQWKEWCDLLGLDIGEVTEIWDVICFPMMVASRSIPDVVYILQMRAARPDLDLEEVKEELAPILHTNALLGSLQDESITGGKYRAAVLQIVPLRRQLTAGYDFVARVCSSYNSRAVFDRIADEGAAGRKCQLHPLGPNADRRTDLSSGPVLDGRAGRTDRRGRRLSAGPR